MHAMYGCMRCVYDGVNLRMDVSVDVYASYVYVCYVCIYMYACMYMYAMNAVVWYVCYVFVCVYAMYACM